MGGFGIKSNSMQNNKSALSVIGDFKKKKRDVNTLDEVKVFKLSSISKRLVD